jgi:uncharacterized membrane protein YeaQ/YmgE (transglycosylase-associated protein family)
MIVKGALGVVVGDAIGVAARGLRPGLVLAGLFLENLLGVLGALLFIRHASLLSSELLVETLLAAKPAGATRLQ